MHALRFVYADVVQCRGSFEYKPGVRVQLFALRDHAAIIVHLEQVVVALGVCAVVGTCCKQDVCCGVMHRGASFRATEWENRSPHIVGRPICICMQKV